MEDRLLASDQYKNILRFNKIPEKTFEITMTNNIKLYKNRSDIQNINKKAHKSCNTFLIVK